MSNSANLFVVGCPRSGTTALGTFLAQRSDVVLGIERYGHRHFARNFSLAPDLFECERFHDFQSGDTFYDSFDFSPLAYNGVREKFDTAQWIGDKIPALYQSLPQLFDAFDDRTRVVAIYRNIFDVAASYKARQADPADSWNHGIDTAISDWSGAIKAYNTSEFKDRIIPVVYEDFATNPDVSISLLETLGLDHDADSQEALKGLFARSQQLETGRKRDLTMSEVMTISMQAPFGGFRTIVDIARQAYAKP